jgi:hypothetical protein
VTLGPSFGYASEDARRTWRAWAATLVGTRLATLRGMSKPKRETFEIAVRSKCEKHAGTNGWASSKCADCDMPGRETRVGYVLGDWATHKEPGKGVYFWTFTHRPTGLAVTVYPCHETKASALAHLAKLADGTAEQVATTETMLAKFGRGWGATKTA